MAYFEWDDTLSVKIESIDNQHRKIIDLINDFYGSIRENTGNVNTRKLIVGMKDYTLQHFRIEEIYMKKYGYPDYEMHKQEHDLFVAKVSDLEEKLNQGKLIVSFEITGFLKEWVKKHIQGTDKKYTEFFISKGIV
ncbi:MAG: bacteriohemerythrin [Bacteroidales bacterium]|jgi:hemerythrin